MSKVKLSLFLLLMIVGVILAGCSSSTNEKSGATEPADPKSESTAEVKEDNQSDAEKTDENASDEKTRYYFTANEGGSISKIDATSNQVIATIEVDGAVHNVQVSPDGTMLGATVVPGMDHGGGESMEMNGLALFYSTETDELLQTVEVGSHPAHIVFTEDGKYALVTNNEDNNVTVIDVNSFSVTHTIKTGKGPHGFRISADSKFAYIANMGEDTISVLNLENMTEEKRITVGSTPVTTGITADGKTLVTTLNKENALAIVDLATDKVDKVQVGTGPAQVYIDGNNQKAYVANQGTEDTPSNSVTVVDLAAKTAVTTIETGKGAHGVVTSPDSKYLYVTNMFENTVSVIDTEQNKVIETIQVGEIPNGISIMK
ncbi:YncE family protein [Bacillus sp. V33-4]|uniref:YncE family protein n=1 Tax=Bacillus sp. V33-4 TaxID=2054169 RepID=UPI000C759870|nr:YncE family protein [Bacillus sp. V33-4]PLR83998.1 YVTN family beta-propeller repeat-containing protein [Bacillus sp. V33-4]